MKSYVNHPLLITVLVAASLLFVFYLVQSANEKKTSQDKVITKTSQGLPIRLKIPSINLSSKIQYVGVNSKGEMDVPNNSVDVGWFNLGPRPGERGSAVIAGHFDGQNGEAGVFNNLYKLKKGDKIYIEFGEGAFIAFIVRSSRAYDPGYADNVFISNDGSHLNLITCDGVWDGVKKSYSKRLVVFADQTQAIK